MDRAAAPEDTPAPVAANDCHHTPKSDTVYTDTGLAVSMNDALPEDYPLDAVCLLCRKPIRAERYFSTDWTVR